MIFRQPVGLLSHCSFSLKKKNVLKWTIKQTMSDNEIIICWYNNVCTSLWLYPLYSNFCVGLLFNLLFISPHHFFFIYLNFSSLPSSPFSPFYLNLNPTSWFPFYPKFCCLASPNFPFSMWISLVYISLLITVTLFLWLTSSTPPFSSLSLSIFLYLHSHIVLAYYPLANEVAKGYIYTHTLQSILPSVTSLWTL
jgi:hypothetical protein